MLILVGDGMCGRINKAIAALCTLYQIGTLLGGYAAIVVVDGAHGGYRQTVLYGHIAEGNGLKQFGHDFSLRSIYLKSLVYILCYIHHSIIHAKCKKTESESYFPNAQKLTDVIKFVFS
jgi:hypothetical protein